MSTELLAPVWTHLTDLQPVKAQGCYYFDEQGNRYLDFTSGIGVINTGHCHPRVVDAIRAQADNMIFAQLNVVMSPAVVRLAQKLNSVTPTEIDRFFFSNSGAEAVEAAVKLARQATGRRNIIVMQGSFHGRTHQTMAMTTSKYVYRHDYQPLPGAVFVTPFPYSYYYGWDEKTTVDFCLKQLDLLLHSQSAADETAAIVIEPVLGEGGYVPVPDAFLQELRKLCDRTGILLIVDEVQSGFGRTGKFFAFEHADIVPDIIIMAKGLGSGMPISGIASRAELMNKWTPGTHGGTYGGGNAVVAAAAAATIDVINDEHLPENAAEMGAYLMQELRKVMKSRNLLCDIRGRGLMVAVEFSDEEGAPNAAMADAILAACLEQRLLLLNCGSYRNILRWIPPLIVTRAQIDEAVEIYAKAVARQAS